MPPVSPRMLSSVLLTLAFFVHNSSIASDESGPVKLKIITHNVWYGFTKKTEPRYGNWKRWMKAQSPDVVSLQELNGYTAEKLQADAKSWGHTYSELLKEDGFPTGITSRFPITDVKRIRDGFHHGLLRCRIQGIWFYVIHFHPSNFQWRIQEAELLRQDVRSLPEENPQVVLAGDFNGFSPADESHYDSDDLLVPFFRGLDLKNANARNLNGGRIDYGGIQAILDQGYTDLVASLRPPQLPFVGTFPGALVRDQDHGTDRRLDYIFVSPSLLDQMQSVAILRDPCTELLSDHIPVTATIRLREEVDKVSVFLSEPRLLQETGAGEGPAGIRTWLVNQRRGKHQSTVNKWGAECLVPQRRFQRALFRQPGRSGDLPVGTTKAGAATSRWFAWKCWQTIIKA